MVDDAAPNVTDLKAIGWGSPKDILIGMVAPKVAAKRRRSSMLAVLRSLFVSFCASLVMIGFVVLFLATDASGAASLSGAAACGIVALIGIAITIGLTFFMPTLSCGSPGQVLGQYRSRFFLRVAFAQAGALIGFGAFFLSGNPVAFFVGLPIALFNLIRFAPTTANIVSEDRRLAAQGCDCSLATLFTQPVAAPATPAGGPDPSGQLRASSPPSALPEPTEAADSAEPTEPPPLAGWPTQPRPPVPPPT